MDVRFRYSDVDLFEFSSSNQCSLKVQLWFGGY